MPPISDEIIDDKNSKIVKIQTDQNTILYKQKIHELDSIILEQEEENLKLKKELEMAKNERNEVANDMAALQSKIIEEKAHWNMNKGAIAKEIKNVADPLREEIAELTEELYQNDQNFKKKVASAKEPLENKIYHLENQLRQKSQMNQTERSELSQLRQKNSALQSQIARVEKEKKRIQEQSMSLTSKVNTLQSTINEKIAKAKAPLVQEIESLNEKIEMAYQELADKNRKVASLEKRVNDFDNEQAVVKNKNQELLLRLDGIKDHAQNKVSKAVEPLEKKISILEEGLREANIEKREIDNDLQELREKHQTVLHQKEKIEK